MHVPPERYLAGLIVRQGNDMKRLGGAGAAAVVVMVVSGPVAYAEFKYDDRGLVFEKDSVTVQAKGAVGLQASWYEPVEGGVPATGTEFDASGLFIAEWETDSGLLFGLRGELDTGNTDIDNFERDELYAYVAADWGRIEAGENDGPADTLSFHAPTLGLGQVRGDFGRYTGSVALLSPYDSRDAMKVSYYAPPVNGFSAGVSWSPEFTSNEDAANPRSRVIQNDVYEIGGQYVRPVGNWIAGVSAAYVSGSADPVTDRADLESWSLGTELRRGKLTLGGAYVDRGRSSLRPNADTEDEWNVGAAWEEDRWEGALSYAVTTQGEDVDHRVGLGIDFDLSRYVYVRTDVVRLVSERPTIENRDGWVVLTELGLRF